MVTAHACWGLRPSATLVVVMGTQVRWVVGGHHATSLLIGTCAPVLSSIASACARPPSHRATLHTTPPLLKPFTTPATTPHAPLLPPPQYYEAGGTSTGDYPVTDLIQMIGRASRPGLDDVGKVRAAAVARGSRGRGSPLVRTSGADPLTPTRLLSPSNAPGRPQDLPAKQA